MSYILKGNNEAARLDEQTDIPEFSLSEELKGIKIKKGSSVLDAGCGSGVLCRFLENKSLDLKISGCDMSSASLEHARNKSIDRKSKYFYHNIVEDTLPGRYDHIFNRLVAHHLNISNYKKVLTNFYSALETDGQVCIIDPDGLFLNIGTLSQSLLKKIKLVNQEFGGNLSIGRSIPALLKEVGFGEIKWEIQTMDFQEESRSYEVRQWKERFENSLDFYINIFGNEFEARLFFKEYLTEALKPDVPLFYNKFVITAKKGH